MKAYLFLFSILFLFSCHSKYSSEPLHFSSPPPSADKPEKGNQKYKITQNFKYVKDDETKNHNIAWQDSKGDEWSPLVFENVSAKNLNSSCASIGGRPPTAAQLNSLAQDLGRGLEVGFHPEYVTATWSLAHKLFWSSDSGQPDYLKGMDGDTGVIQEIPLMDVTTHSEKLANAICVVGDGNIYYQCRSHNRNFELVTLRMVISRDADKITSSFRLDVSNSNSEITQYIQEGQVTISVGGSYPEIAGQFQANGVELNLDAFSGGTQSRLVVAGQNPISLTCGLL